MKKMAEREKVIRGLECCKWSRQNVKPEKNKCDECPYKDKNIMNAYTVWRSCTNVLAEDALTLLKEQEARVMTPYEVRAEYEIVWLDRKNISCEVAILQRIACSMYEFSIMGTDEMPSLLESQYGKTWRCWSARPTEEQRKVAKWG